MDRRFVENHHVASLAGDIVDQLAISLIPFLISSGQDKICFVAARNDAEPTISFIHIGQLELADDHAATHLAVCIAVMLGTIEDDG